MARYYDPKVGRYISSDPIGLRGGLNTYLYARANPLRYIDPKGLEEFPGDVPSYGPGGFPSTPDAQMSDPLQERMKNELRNEWDWTKKQLQSCELWCDLGVGMPCKAVAIRTGNGLYGGWVYVGCNVASYKACKWICKDDAQNNNSCPAK